MTQSNIKTELGSNRLFQDVIKQIKIGIYKQCAEAEKGFQQKDALTIHNGITFRGVVPFIPPKLRPTVMAKAYETNPGKNETETAVRMMAWWPGISQGVLRYVNVRNAKKTGIAWGKQYLLGWKLKFGKDSTWTGAT